MDGRVPTLLLDWSQRLAADVRSLRRVLPGVAIAPLEYATRAHEILEDAARDLLSGAAVPWSGEGVLGTGAGLAATEEIVATLRPLLGGQLAVVRVELAQLRSALNAIAAAHGGRLPPSPQLTRQQAETLDGALGAALEALAQVPGDLETTLPRAVPQLPKRDVRMDS